MPAHRQARAAVPQGSPASGAGIRRADAHAFAPLYRPGMLTPLFAGSQGLLPIAAVRNRAGAGWGRSCRT
jgi:hypothetical protein